MRISILWFTFLAGTAVFAQKFEVASIKPNGAEDNRVMIRMMPGGRFTATGISVKQLLSQAYDVREFQIQGLPGWASADRFDVNAKAEGQGD